MLAAIDRDASLGDFNRQGAEDAKLLGRDPEF
jgi:hypothetical protein